MILPLVRKEKYVNALSVASKIHFFADQLRHCTRLKSAKELAYMLDDLAFDIRRSDDNHREDETDTTARVSSTASADHRCGRLGSRG